MQECLVTEQLERREHVAAGDHGACGDLLAGRGAHTGDAVTFPGDRDSAVAEAHRAARPAEPFGQRAGQGAAAANGAPRRPAVHEGVPADEVRGGDLVGRRAGLRAEPRQGGLEPLVVEQLVEQLVARLQELPGHLQAADLGGSPGAPQMTAEFGGGGRVLERPEHRLVAGAPVGDEPPVGVRVAVSTERGDRGAGAFEVDVEGQRLLVVRRPERRERPRVHVEIGQPALVESELLDDAGVADHDVHARAPVDRVARPPLDRRHRATEHRVALDDLDVEARPREIAGRDQGVVSAADDDDVAGPGHLAESRKGVVRDARLDLCGVELAGSQVQLAFGAVDDHLPDHVVVDG